MTQRSVFKDLDETKEHPTWAADSHDDQRVCLINCNRSNNMRRIMRHTLIGGRIIRLRNVCGSFCDLNDKTTTRRACCQGLFSVKANTILEGRDSVFQVESSV